MSHHTADIGGFLRFLYECPLHADLVHIVGFLIADYAICLIDMCLSDEAVCIVVVCVLILHIYFLAHRITEIFK